MSVFFSQPKSNYTFRKRPVIEAKTSSSSEDTTSLKKRVHQATSETFSSATTSEDPKKKERKIDFIVEDVSVAPEQTILAQSHFAETISTSSAAVAEEFPCLSTPPSSPKKASYMLSKHFALKTPRAESILSIKAPFALRALEILDSMQLNNKTRIIPVRELYGQHSQIYTVHSNDDLIEGISNNDIYVKIFHEDVIKTYRNAIQNSFIPNILSQYDALQSEGLGVVTILNRDRVLTDGYIVVERLSPFIVTWDASAKVSELSEESRRHLDYLLRLFRYGLTNPSSVPLDLHIGNFGLNAEGNLVLLDFMEKSEDEPYAFRLYAKIHAQSLSNRSTEIYQEFKNVAKELADSNQSPIASLVYELMSEVDR
ncbi:MAG: hypothetical protein FJZ57_00175 [Chlamydiae bacterium]|nr:hypothetical protein [Chlamydiota bacterium]